MARVLASLLFVGQSAATASSLYDLSAVDIDGRTLSLDFEGNVTVAMNVATK